MIVGRPDADAIHEACDAVQDRIGRAVNPTTLTPEEIAAPTDFLRHVAANLTVLLIDGPIAQAGQRRGPLTLPIVTDPTDRSTPFRLLEGVRRALLVHAHPDDETLATGALIAALVEAGVEVHVVTATRGERGELMPGVVDVAPGSEEFAAHRERELATALDRLGVGHHAYLGMPPARDPANGTPRHYQDSGMRWIRDGVAGPAKDAPADSLTAAAPAEAAADLAAYVAATHPDVLVSYDEGGGYGHPDHVRTHEVTRAVARARGIRMLEVIPPDREVGGDPGAIEWTDASDQLVRVREALRAHATQVRVDGDDVVHVGGQREPIVTRVGLRRVEG